MSVLTMKKRNHLTARQKEYLLLLAEGLVLQGVGVPPGVERIHSHSYT
jgi:hypothetical protein